MTTDITPSRRHTSAIVPRRQRRAELEARIEQQRIDIFVAASRWRRATQPIDDGWRIMLRFKVPFYALGGALLATGARHPGSLARLARRVAAGGLLFHRARRLLRRVA